LTNIALVLVDCLVDFIVTIWINGSSRADIWYVAVF